MFTDVDGWRATDRNDRAACHGLRQCRLHFFVEERHQCLVELKYVSVSKACSISCTRVRTQVPDRLSRAHHPHTDGVRGVFVANWESGAEQYKSFIGLSAVLDFDTLNHALEKLNKHLPTHHKCWNCDAGCTCKWKQMRCQFPQQQPK